MNNIIELSNLTKTFNVKKRHGISKYLHIELYSMDWRSALFLIKFGSMIYNNKSADFKNANAFQELRSHLVLRFW